MNSKLKTFVGVEVKHVLLGVSGFQIKRVFRFIFQNRFQL